MSKTKTKQARREVKRAAQKKAANFAKASAKPTGVSKSSSAKPTPKTTSTSSTAAAKATQNKGLKKADSSVSETQTATTTPHVQASQKKEIPFGVYENVLLVGEGDFSFTRSLAIEHGCAGVVGTSFDSEEVVREKYPSFAAIETDLKALTPPVPIHHSIDATKLSSYKHLRPTTESLDDSDSPHHSFHTSSSSAKSWDTIAFQFPHTGGLSTDTNRQVRANQALISAFFHAVLDKTPPKTAPTSVPNTSSAHPNNPHNPKHNPHPESARATNPNLAPLGAPRVAKSARERSRAPKAPFLKVGGRVILTLFEGEPYTLWNIRDLARHAGLKVVESFKFDWSQYPGYAHVRTLGALEGGGGWKGEDRAARMYVFEKVEGDKKGRGDKKAPKGERVGNVGKVMGEGWRNHRELEEVGSESE